MTFLPIVQYELRAAARRRSTFIARLACSGIALLGAVFYILHTMTGTATALGNTAFHTMSFFAVALCCLIPLILAHDCISEERGNGTLGLLMLTDLKAYDIVFGKLLGISLNAFYCLLGVLPTLALPLLLGGIEVGEFWRMCFALANLMFVCFAVAVTVSSFCVSSRASFTLTMAALLFVCAAVPALPDAVAVISPLHAVTHAFETAYLADTDAFGRSLFLSNVFAFLLLGIASRNLPRTIAREGTSAQKAIRRQVKARDRALLQTDPVQWLLLDSSVWSKSISVITTVLIISLLGAALLPRTNAYHSVIAWPLAGALVIFKLLFAQQSSRFFVDARRTGALEVICSTPLPTQEIIRAQWRALRSVFLIPTILLLACYFIALQTAPFAPILTLQSRTSVVGYDAPLLSLYIVLLFAFDLIAIGWFSMWLSFSLAKPQFAVIFTILLAVVVPAVVIIFPHPLITLTLLVVGRSRLREYFRTGTYVPGSRRLASS
jgi:ABC-type transport system involved in multi-copper enzyme maturation permease subunit